MCSPGSRYFADTLASFVTEAADDFDLTEIVLLDVTNGLVHSCIGAIIEIGLDHPIVFTCGLDYFAPFENVVGDGFFDIDVLAGLTGSDGDQGVPVIGGGGGHGIDVFILQHLVQIGIGIDFLFVFVKFFSSRLRVSLSGSHSAAIRTPEIFR